MKKKILILMTALMMVFSVTFAKSSDYKVPQTISAVFAHDFSYASDVNWVVFDGFYKASFTDHGKIVFAFYTANGELMGMATNMLSDGLPADLQKSIKNNYSGYWITELFHFNINSTPGYFVTLENGDQQIKLQAEENQSWSIYAVVKKN